MCLTTAPQGEDLKRRYNLTFIKPAMTRQHFSLEVLFELQHSFVFKKKKPFRDVFYSADEKSLLPKGKRSCGEYYQN